jgi:cobalt/nickel transport system permease protein
LLISPHPRFFTLGAFLTGFCALGLSGLIMAACLAFSGAAFLPLAWLVLLGHLPLMPVEGLISLAAVKFLSKVKPEVLAFVPPSGTYK